MTDSHQSIKSLWSERLFGWLPDLKREDRLDLSEDGLYQAYRELDFKNEELAALIGVSFRLTSANLALTSDILNNAGYIKPKNLQL